MKQREKTKVVDKEYLTIKETATRLGVSERLLRDFLKDPVHPLTHFRIGNGGRLIRIKKSDIDTWMENFRSTSEINIDEIVADLML